jgi:hypothetical protein
VEDTRTPRSRSFTAENRRSAIGDAAVERKTGFEPATLTLAR